MTCINRVTFTVMVAFSAPWCWCYGQVLPSASRSQPPELSTNPLPNTDTLPVFSESHNSTNKSEDRLPTRAFGVSLLEKAVAAEDALPLEFGPPEIVEPTYETLGKALLELGRRDEAKAAFQRATERTPLRKPATDGLTRAS